MKKASLPGVLRPENKNTLVRIGGRHDGGYIISSAQLDKAKHLLSFGLGYDCRFEKDMIYKGNIDSLHCYDHTICERQMRSLYINSVLKYIWKTSKRKEPISVYRRYREVFGKSFSEHIRLKVSSGGNAGEVSLTEALERLTPTGNDIFLKCDIEGSEFEIIESIVDNAHRFCGMAFEFHDLTGRMDEFVDFVERLKNNFVIDHVHINNNGIVTPEGVPDVVEISFSRKDIPEYCERSVKSRETLPFSKNGRDLDRPNEPGRPDFEIVYL